MQTVRRYHLRFKRSKDLYLQFVFAVNNIHCVHVLIDINSINSNNWLSLFT